MNFNLEQLRSRPIRPTILQHPFYFDSTKRIGIQKSFSCRRIDEDSFRGSDRGAEKRSGKSFVIIIRSFAMLERYARKRKRERKKEKKNGETFYVFLDVTMAELLCTPRN